MRANTIHLKANPRKRIINTDGTTVAVTDIEPESEKIAVDEIGIKIERHSEHDIYYDAGSFSINSGVSEGEIDVDWRGAGLVRIGKALRRFPRKTADEFHHSIDSDHSTHLVIRAHADKTGHTSLDVTIWSSEMCSEGGRSFLIAAEPKAINRLGDLLLEFSKPKYRSLKWSLQGDADALLEWETVQEPLSKRLKRGWKRAKDELSRPGPSGPGVGTDYS